MSEKILNIWKEIVYLAAKYSNYSEKDKNKILKKFWEYKREIWERECKYSKTVLGFIEDLESDISSWRKLEIDSIDHDNYLENYFITQREVNHYNNLINSNIYREIFDDFYNDRNPEKILSLTKKISNNFENEYIKLSPENIAKNLLIFSNFDKKIISDWLKNLYKIFTLMPNNSDLFIELRKINSLYYQLIQEVYSHGIKHYNNEDYTIYYARFIKDNDNITLKKINASQMNFRTGNHKYEYKQLLLKLRY